MADKLAKLSTTGTPLSPPQGVHYKHVNTRLNVSDMFSALYQHCFQEWAFNTRPTHEVMLTKLSFVPCYGLLYQSVTSLLLFSVCAQVTANWTIICHVFAYTLTDYVASVKYPKQWNTLLKSVPNTWRRENVWNLHSINSVFLFIPRKSSVAQLLQNL